MLRLLYNLKRSCGGQQTTSCQSKLCGTILLECLHTSLCTHEDARVQRHICGTTMIVVHCQFPISSTSWKVDSKCLPPALVWPKFEVKDSSESRCFGTTIQATFMRRRRVARCKKLHTLNALWARKIVRDVLCFGLASFRAPKRRLGKIRCTIG